MRTYTHPSLPWGKVQLSTYIHSSWFSHPPPVWTKGAFLPLTILFLVFTRSTSHHLASNTDALSSCHTISALTVFSSRVSSSDVRQRLPRNKKWAFTRLLRGSLISTPATLTSPNISRKYTGLATCQAQKLKTTGLARINLKKQNKNIPIVSRVRLPVRHVFITATFLHDHLTYLCLHKLYIPSPHSFLPFFLV